MIKAVILDCFGVLYVPVGEDFYRSHLKNYDEVKDQLRELEYRSDLGQITQEQLNERVAEIGGIDVDEVRKSIVGQYVRNKALLNFAQSLRPKIKVALLSNINAESIDQFFSSDERNKFFDASVISGEVGVAKPNPLIFEMVAQKLGVLPSECVMVDDSGAHCDGAQEAGMKSVLFESTDGAISQINALL
ncbi:MAG TPA: HAD family phosphatase [Candidatus Saccharimonadales bacterium]|nr:HAD family phosphatase [Candidatus Saccharimonadales bacterium]